MVNAKLDMKDRRLLDVLDKDANISLSRLAKKIGVSTQVVEYRIQKLISQGTIYSFFTLIDPGRLGHTLFRVHIKLKNVRERIYLRFAKELFQEYPTYWVAFVSGSFDIIADLWSRNSNQFEELFKKILENNKEIIHSYEINPILEINLFSYGYFLKETKDRDRVTLFRNITDEHIDDTDEKILGILKANSRMPYEVIGRKVGLTRNAVKYRIHKLEKAEIINGYKIMVDFKHFNRLTYKVFLKYDNSKIEQEQQLLMYLQQIPGILAATKHLGRWNLDIEIEPKSAKELQTFIIELRNKFSIIENYEFIQILEDYGLDYFPDRLISSNSN